MNLAALLMLAGLAALVAIFLFSELKNEPYAIRPYGRQQSLSALVSLGLIAFTLGALSLLISALGPPSRSASGDATAVIQTQPPPAGTETPTEPPTEVVAVTLESTVAPSPEPTPTPTATPVRHTVAAGQTLWEIAFLYYGDGNLWPAICEANRQLTGDCTIITTGQTLTIPGLFGE